MQMKFKPDENFGARTEAIFRNSGFDVQTVRQEGLGGSRMQICSCFCCAAARCLVTLDLGFANVLAFRPGHGAGIVGIRFPGNPTLPLL